MIDFDALIDAELSSDYYGRWDDDDREASWRSHRWWAEKHAKKRVCQKCQIRTPQRGNYGTCEPCLDGIAAFYESMGDLKGDEDAELD